MSKLKFTLAGAATTAVAAALMFAGVAPASAIDAPRSLPVGDAMYALDCADGDLGSVVQLYSVNAVTAEPTPVGDGTVHWENGSCSHQPAWNAATSTAYFIERTFIDGSIHFLMTVDLATGESTELNPFFEGDDTYIPIEAMAISPTGAAYGFFGGAFYSIDLATSQVTFVGETPTGIFGFGFDPKTGALWAIDTEGVVYTVALADGAATVVGDLDVDASPDTRSLQVDSAGVLWVVNNYNDEGFANELWSGPQSLAADENWLQGSFNSFNELLYSEALLIVPAPVPALAATGSSFDGSLAVGGAALLLLAGVTFVVVRRRATTA